MTTKTSAAWRVAPMAMFVSILFSVFWLWVIARFLHRDAQSRILAPDQYEVQVLSAADYRRIADPRSRVVKLSNGTTIEKAEVWDRIVLPNYKPVDGGERYVLVTARGTAPFLSYIEPHYLLIGTMAAFGAGISMWRLRAEPHGGEPPG